MGFNLDNIERHLNGKDIAMQAMEEMKSEIEEVNELAFDPTKLYPVTDRRDEHTYKEIEIEKLKKNTNNHFHPIEGEKWEEFVGSIKAHGILTPLIIRKIDEADGKEYEILAGHNRTRGAIEVGLSKVPCIIVDVDDVEASVIVAATNAQRENTTDLEWAWAYRATYEALKKSIGRPNKINVPTVGTLNSDDENKCTHGGNILEKPKRTIDIVAEKYGVGKNTIARKIRLTYLSEQLYNYCVSKKVSQEAMCNLSYLDELHQSFLLNSATDFDVVFDKEFTLAVKNEINNDCDVNYIHRFCKEWVTKKELERTQKEENKKTKPKNVKRLKLEISRDLIPETVNVVDKNETFKYVMQALGYIKQNNIDVSEVILNED